MKKAIIMILMICLLLASGSTLAAAEGKAPVWLKIGLKYGGSAPFSAALSSDGVFELTSKGSHTGKITSLNEKNIVLTAVDSHYVVVGEFNDHASAAGFCSGKEYSVLFKGGRFYAVCENLYSESELHAALSKQKSDGLQAYTLNSNKERIRIEDKSGKTLLIFAGDGGDSLAISSPAGQLSFNGTKYRDYLEFKREGSGIAVISVVTTEHYLYSVVPSEIGGSAPFEAQKAQAVCARTYAAKNINKHIKSGFNICPTTCCQTYSGMSVENPTSNRAVDETAGKVITYKGEVISAVYSTWSGGQTADAETVWGSVIPYLVAVADPFGADYKWDYDIDYDKITVLMASKGYNIGKVTGVAITDTASDGRVTELTIKGENGEKKFLRENARTILGLKSQLYFIEGNKIFGYGYGHGVGLCQHGAMGLAEQGLNYKQIIKYYYTGVEIE